MDDAQNYYITACPDLRPQQATSEPEASGLHQVSTKGLAAYCNCWWSYEAYTGKGATVKRVAMGMKPTKVRAGTDVCIYCGYYVFRQEQKSIRGSTRKKGPTKYQATVWDPRIKRARNLGRYLTKKEAGAKVEEWKKSISR